MTAQKTGKGGGSEEVWCLRAPPRPPTRQLSPGSCVQAGETLLARGGGEGERLGKGLAWVAISGSFSTQGSTDPCPQGREFFRGLQIPEGGQFESAQP